MQSMQKSMHDNYVKQNPECRAPQIPLVLEQLQEVITTLENELGSYLERTSDLRNPIILAAQPQEGTEKHCVDIQNADRDQCAPLVKILKDEERRLRGCVMVLQDANSALEL